MPTIYCSELGPEQVSMGVSVERSLEENTAQYPRVTGSRITDDFFPFHYSFYISPRFSHFYSEHVLLL